jgi:hypothetical protein
MHYVPYDVNLTSKKDNNSRNYALAICPYTHRGSLVK